MPDELEEDVEQPFTPKNTATIIKMIKENVKHPALSFFNRIALAEKIGHQIKAFDQFKKLPYRFTDIKPKFCRLYYILIF